MGIKSPRSCSGGKLMSYHRKSAGALLFGGLCLNLVTVPTYGYADPNTVGLISQVLTPLLVIAGACFTFLRKGISSLFGGLWQRLRGTK